MPPRGARRRDSLVGDGFGEVQRAHAPGEHRGERFAQIQAPRVNFAEMRKQLGLDRVSASDQVLKTRQELIAGQTTERRCHRLTSRRPPG
jgi:hypothetical protein